MYRRLLRRRSVETKSAGAGIKPSAASADPAPSHFIRNIVAEDLKQGKNRGRVHTRFPPEPNGYLHIGHAKSICLNFGLAAEFGGLAICGSTIPIPAKKRSSTSNRSKKMCVGSALTGAIGSFTLRIISSSFTNLRVHLIKAGKAYVCDLNADQMREYRGTLTEPGKNSPFRDRSVEENLDLLQRMRAGEFPDGSRTLRAKIDMALAEHQHARSGHVPRAARDASSNRRCMVHLSDLRFRARPVGFHRRNNPFDLHFGVRRSPAALRLVSRSAGHSSSAANRVRAA